MRCARAKWISEIFSVGNSILRKMASSSNGKERALFPASATIKAPSFLSLLVCAEPPPPGNKSLPFFLPTRPGLNVCLLSAFLPSPSLSFVFPPLWNRHSPNWNYLHQRAFTIPLPVFVESCGSCARGIFCSRPHEVTRPLHFLRASLPGRKR